jgi:SAM-dependent methyltransferase
VTRIASHYRQSVPSLRSLMGRRVIQRWRRPARFYLASGNLEPLSRYYGSERGGIIDRYFIEDFVEHSSGRIRGRCLELLDDAYTKRFGGDRVTTSDVLDIDPANPLATIVGDLQALKEVADDAFDCVILTQTLQLLPEPAKGVAELHRMLAPGGTALITVPAMARVSGLTRNGIGDHDYWRFTPAGLRILLERHFSQGDLEVTGRGNVRTGLAFWAGLSRQDLPRKAFTVDDPAFPMLVTAQATKAGA